MKTNIQTIATCILISLLTGCAMGTTESILPQSGPTMKEVYDSRFTGAPLPKHCGDECEDESEKSKENTDINMVRRPNRADHNLVGYTRQADNEIQQLFPRLSNPTLVLYVYPHLTGAERHPVPGYSTAFTLYEKVEYALPGEIEERY